MAAEDEATSPVVTVVAVVVLTGALLLMLRWLLKVRHNLRPKSARCLPWKCPGKCAGQCSGLRVLKRLRRAQGVVFERALLTVLRLCAPAAR